MRQIPNLFRGGDARKAVQTYEMFLARLAVLGRHQRIVEVCRKIRRFAAASGDKTVGAFTDFAEKQAPNRLQNWTTLWRALRAYEAAFYGRRLDLKKRRWKGKGFEILFYYGPRLYFRREYRFGCKLFEKALSDAASQRKNGSIPFGMFINPRPLPPVPIR